MPDAFDPYHTWLGIPPSEQPPDYYRLLGLPRFEEKSEAIEHAADRQMGHLRTLGTGEHAPWSQKLRGEVATARICLLNPEKKAAYDRYLREKLEAKRAQTGKTAATAGKKREQSPGVTITYHHQKSAPLGQLGEYRLIEKLGEGGMGAVYKALHTKLRREVAVKVLPEGRLKDDRAVARFEREMAAVGALDHPNVVRAYDAREIQGVRFLVLELVQGMDLSHLLRQSGPMNVADACEVIRQAALGLQSAHEHGLVHRDVKPSNLMLTPQGRVKVLDLGLARFQLEDSGDELTTGGHALGTVEYMAPEQAASTHTVDVRADVYSLGCTLYKLLTGRSPFKTRENQSAFEIMTAHVKEPLPSIRKIRKDVPAELAAVIAKMLAKDPKGRFATPAEVADAVGPMAAGADLSGQFAHSSDEAAGPAAASQAMAQTAELSSSTSSALTKFFRRMKVEQSKSITERSKTGGGSSKKMPIWVGRLAIGAAAMVCVLVWAVVSSRDSPPSHTSAAKTAPTVGTDPMGTAPAPSRLVLRWPEAERVDAELVIDGQAREVSSLVSEADKDQLAIPLPPGQHRLWIARRGFEPFDKPFMLYEGQDLAVAPELSKTADPFPAEAEPEPEPAMVVQEETASSVPPKEDEADQEARERLFEYEAAEARYAVVVEPVEALVAEWDFRGALAALERIEPDEAEMTSRLTARRDELTRLAELKGRIIEKINTADPPFRTRPLKIRGQNRDIVRADEAGLTTKVDDDPTESLRWSSLEARSVAEILQDVAPPTNGQESLAASLLARIAGDVPLAERHFQSAQSAGLDVAPYQTGLATAAFARARELLADEQYTEADAALTSLEQKYAAIPWFTTHKEPFTAARHQAQRGIFEAEAEALYQQAAEDFANGELFDARNLVEKLKTDYPNSRPLTDMTREPSYAKLQIAVATLGRLMTVRQDDKGDFTSIQQAVDAGPPNSLIVICDDGPYKEQVLIPAEKPGLTIRGAADCWPLITSLGMGNQIGRLLQVHGSNARLERLVLMHGAPTGEQPACATFASERFVLRSIIVAAPSNNSGWSLRTWNEVNDGTLQNCLVLGRAWLCDTAVSNCLFLRNVAAYEPCQFHFCTVLDELQLQLPGSVVLDSIVSSMHIFSGAASDLRIEKCGVFRREPFRGVRPPDGAYSLINPQFRDPKNLDYRLMPDSPCIGKASDGGDLGVRYTPEMIEMCQKALELRAAGIIDF